jgi:hypothetical protein
VVAVELPKAPGYAYGHRNEALARARGDVVLWLADDDLLLPHHLERLGEYWDTGEFGIVTTPAAIVHQDDSLEWIGQDWSVPWNRDEMERNNTNVMSSVSVSVELAQRVGGWDARIERAADWDLWKRVLATGAPAAMTVEATALHFRATGREQGWSSRVAQNAAWLERISDPATLPGVRRLLRRLDAQHDADLRRALEEQRNLSEEQRRENEEQRHDYEARLTAIHDGGWWRLRERLLPLMRLVGRSDAG